MTQTGLDPHNAAPHETPHGQARTGPRRGLLPLLAVATGLSCAGNYVAQPLLDLISRDLGLGSLLAGLVVTASQTGYALGLILLVPLGDVVDRRRLTVALFAATSLFLTVSALAPSGPVLLAGTVLAALASVGAQVVVAHAAALATDETRGRAVATVMAGVLLGGLLARTAAGGLSELGGWRTVYWVLAALMAAAAATLHRHLPRLPVTADLRYPALLRSTFALLRTEPLLRGRALLGALSLGSYSVQLTALTFLLAGAPFHWPAPAIGLFGLVGAVGVAAMTVAARLSDRGHVRKVTGGATALLLAGWLVLLAAERSLLWLALGIVALNIGQQAVLNSSQTVVYALRPEARSRINSAFMTATFLGGALGSAAASIVWASSGWSGICALGALLATGAFAAWGRELLRGRGAHA
ncbi:Inner membrane transport protein YnfM [Streptomyces sp. YIM 130001]|uniref:MFS transporter n=1 Tax=Streptomyces sp. YIM 130001 TaxID=2259644 RepID=UPI000E65D28E|nr:MFS transporter [Streptomyces sp. YIM 130001]RII09375.1 Inner membrane transport protein YnfM [Streptomyces sp. YIM 130001]